MIKDNFDNFDNDGEDGENDFNKLEFKDTTDEINIIDELINGLNIENLELKQELKKGNNEKLNMKTRKTKNEYEIIMNCDESDYIIYYKK